MSAERGAGRTTITTNLAAALGRRGYEVLVLDADFDDPQVGAFLGITPHGDISDVLSGERALDEILVAGPAGVHLAPGSARLHDRRSKGILDHAALIWALDSTREPIDVVLVDTAAGASTETKTLARAAHHVIVVIGDQPTSALLALDLMLTLAREVAVNRFKVLTSRTRTRSEGRALFQKIHAACLGLLDVTVECAGTVPYETAVRRAMHAHRAVIEAEPASSAARAFCTLASQVDSWARPTGVRGHLEFFVERLRAAEAHGGA
jgi:flagellar biosynthesis protein FlhG